MSNYDFIMRKFGYEICRQLYYKDRPSRLTAMFLCEKTEENKKGFIFNNTFYLFIVEEESPIVALRVDDIKDFC